MDRKGEADNYYFIGLLDENAGQGAKAAQDYLNYVQASPKGTYVAQAQQRLTALKANPSNTQKITTVAESKKSGEGQAAYEAAVKLQGDNKFDEAIAQYNTAIATSPNESSYYYGRGTAYQGKGDMDKAIDDYKKALNLNPREATYKQTLSAAQAAKAAPLVESAIKKQTTKDAKGGYDLTGAIADYEAALKMSDDPGTHMNLGTAYQANNNLPRALQEYTKAIQMDPKTCADALYYLGTLYEQMKQPAKAVEEYIRYVKAAPSGQSAGEAKQRIKLLAPGRR